MGNKCEKIKDQIAEFVGGMLPGSQVEALQQHISGCPACMDYAQSLEKEDRQLTELFSELGTDLTRQEDEIIRAIEQLDRSGRDNVLSFAGRFLGDSMTRFTGAAAVVAFTALYFIITLTWILQIKECIRISS